uniref:UV-stimulated scaffold protein A n=1 Tax=Haplochromis burtoni TaxID=8153 RepID=A0A3Q3BQJ8_HAPBU
MDLFPRLSVLVEELTTSGQPQLNQDKMKEVKKLCKVSNDCIDHVYHSVMSQLNQEHAEIRLSAFQIAGELFSRSHHFRMLLVDNFQEFLELTVETDSEQPLPPPKEVARKLRALAVQTVQSWQTSYGSAYKKLALGYNFLKQVKKVDFQDIEARTVAERTREEERRRRMERIYKEKVEAAAKEMEELQQEIEATLTEMESCMRLLFPDFSPIDIQTANSSPSNSQPATKCPSDEEQPCCSKDLRADGRVGKVQERDENTGMTEENRKNWKEKREREKTKKRSEGTEGKDGEKQEMDKIWMDVCMAILPIFLVSLCQLLRRALDLKRSLEATLQKHEELHIDYKARVRKVMKVSSDGEEEEDDDDDFDEVPEKEGYEPHIPEHLRAEYGLDPSPSTSTGSVAEKKPSTKKPAAPPLSSSSYSSTRRLKQLAEEVQDPTSVVATLHLLREKMPPSSSAEPSSSQSSSKQTSVNAPVVPFGLDLFYWGQEQPSAGRIIKSASQHQFWVPAEVEEEVENEELLAESRSRYISFPGSFVPVSHFCRAPLGDGKLCQRQDRFKCPFHGPIVPRDQEGRPCRQEDREREEQEERRKREQQPDWRDAELMRDIEAATGEDLGSERLGGKKGKGKKKKYPHLSDLKQSSNTSRCRLEKKVFNKSSLRRVAQVMNKADKRKHDKFSNQFNYALN